MRAYIETLSCKGYCLPATGSAWCECGIIHICAMPYMLHDNPAWRNTLHPCNAVWDTLNPILHECNAPYMAMPIGTGITLVQYGMQCIHANRQTMRHCHIPTDALPCDETKKSGQIWNKLYTLNSSLWRKNLYLSLWATRKAVWENPRSRYCSPVTSITWRGITYW